MMLHSASTISWYISGSEMRTSADSCERGHERVTVTITGNSYSYSYSYGYKSQ